MVVVCLQGFSLVAKVCCISAMGVKDLWKILSKAKRKVDVKELRGKTLAVDLSCWTYQFSSVKGTGGP